MIISLIAAISENRVIGVQNRLPWHLPADLVNFKKITKDRKFIMGRKSYEAADKLCSDAGNVVITRQKNYKVAKGDSTASSLQQAIEKLKGENEVFVLGGAEIFAQAMERLFTLDQIAASVPLWKGSNRHPVLGLARKQS